MSPDFDLSSAIKKPEAPQPQGGFDLSTAIKKPPISGPTEPQAFDLSAAIKPARPSGGEWIKQPLKTRIAAAATPWAIPAEKEYGKLRPWGTIFTPDSPYTVPDVWKQEWGKGRMAITRGRAGFDLMMGKGDKNKAMEQAMLIDEQMSKLPALPRMDIKDPRSLIANIGGAGSHLLPFMIGAFGESLKWGAAGAATGAMVAGVAGQLGPQAATPEEIVTVPSGTIIGAKRGFRFGQKFGIVKYSVEVEGGNLYLDMLQRGISEETAKPMAFAGGIIIGLIEAEQVDILTNPFKKAAAPLVGKTISKMGIKAARKAVESEPTKKILLKALTEYLKTIGVESAQEVAQEAIGMAAQTLAAIKDDADVPTKEEWKDTIIETMKMSLKGFPVIAAPGAVLSTTSKVGWQSFANRQKKAMEEAALGGKKTAISRKVPLDTRILKEVKITKQKEGKRSYTGQEIRIKGDGKEINEVKFKEKDDATRTTARSQVAKTLEAIKLSTKPTESVVESLIDNVVAEFKGQETSQEALEKFIIKKIKDMSENNEAHLYNTKQTRKEGNLWFRNTLMNHDELADRLIQEGLGWNDIEFVERKDKRSKSTASMAYDTLKATMIDKGIRGIGKFDVKTWIKQQSDIFREAGVPEDEIMSWVKNDAVMNTVRAAAVAKATGTLTMAEAKEVINIARKAANEAEMGLGATIAPEATPTTPKELRGTYDRNMAAFVDRNFNKLPKDVQDFLSKLEGIDLEGEANESGIPTTVTPQEIGFRGTHWIALNDIANNPDDFTDTYRAMANKSLTEINKLLAEAFGEDMGFEQRGRATSVGPWTRQSVAADARSLYVFTDNTDRTSGGNPIPRDAWYSKKYGPGGRYPGMTQAVARGLDNARPISTMKHIGSMADARAGRTQWQDTDFDFNLFKQTIDSEVADIKKALPSFPGGLKYSRGQKIGQGAISRLPARFQEYLDTKLLEVGIDQRVEDMGFEQRGRVPTVEYITEGNYNKIEQGKLTELSKLALKEGNLMKKGDTIVFKPKGKANETVVVVTGVTPGSVQFSLPTKETLSKLGIIESGKLKVEAGKYKAISPQDRLNRDLKVEEFRDLGYDIEVKREPNIEDTKVIFEGKEYTVEQFKREQAKYKPGIAMKRRRNSTLIARTFNHYIVNVARKMLNKYIDVNNFTFLDAKDMNKFITEKEFPHATQAELAAKRSTIQTSYGVMNSYKGWIIINFDVLERHLSDLLNGQPIPVKYSVYYYLKQYEEAKETLLKAKKLFQEQNNPEAVQRVEKALHQMKTLARKEAVPLKFSDTDVPYLGTYDEAFRFTLEHEIIHAVTGLDGGEYDEVIVDLLALERMGLYDAALDYEMKLYDKFENTGIALTQGATSKNQRAWEQGAIKTGIPEWDTILQKRPRTVSEDTMVGQMKFELADKGAEGNVSIYEEAVMSIRRFVKDNLNVDLTLEGDFAEAIHNLLNTYPNIKAKLIRFMNHNGMISLLKHESKENIWMHQMGLSVMDVLERSKRDILNVIARINSAKREALWKRTAYDVGSIVDVIMPNKRLTDVQVINRKTAAKSMGQGRPKGQRIYVQVSNDPSLGWYPEERVYSKQLKKVNLDILDKVEGNEIRKIILETPIEYKEQLKQYAQEMLNSRLFEKAQLLEDMWEYRSAFIEEPNTEDPTAPSKEYSTYAFGINQIIRMLRFLGPAVASDKFEKLVNSGPFKKYFVHTFRKLPGTTMAMWKNVKERVVEATHATLRAPLYQSLWGSKIYGIIIEHYYDKIKEANPTWTKEQIIDEVERVDRLSAPALQEIEPGTTRHTFGVTDVGQQHVMSKDEEAGLLAHYADILGVDVNDPKVQALKGQPRPKLFFFNQLPAWAQDTLVWYKRKVSNVLLDEQLKMGVFSEANIYHKSKLGYAPFIAIEKSEIKKSRRPGYDPLQSLKKPPSQYDTFSESWHKAIVKGDLVPIDSFSLMARDYTMKSLHNIMAMHYIEILKNIPVGAKMNLVEYSYRWVNARPPEYVAWCKNQADPKLKDPFSTEAAEGFLGSLGYLKAQNMPGLASWYRGFNVPWVHESAYEIIDKMTKPLGEMHPFARTILTINQVVKRVVLYTPLQFALQISLHPEWLNWNTVWQKGIRPIIPWGNVKAMKGWRKLFPGVIPEVIREGFALGGKMWKGEYRPLEHLKSYDHELMDRYLRYGMPSFNVSWAMANMYDVKFSNEHPLMRDHVESIKEFMNTRGGLDAYIFNNYIAQNIFELTKKFDEMFQSMGMDKETAARRAVYFMNDISGMTSSAIYGRERVFLQMMLFARDFTMTFLRQFTGASFYLWEKYHGYKTNGIGQAFNSLLHGEKTTEDMQVLAPFYAQHLARIMFWKLVFINMMQFGISWYDDDEKERGKFAFQNEPGKQFAIKLPSQFKHGPSWVYADVLCLREANQMSDLLGIFGGRGAGQLFKNKLSYTFGTMIPGMVMEKDLTGRMITGGAEIPTWQRWTDRFQHMAWKGLPTVAQGDVRKPEGLLMSQAFGVPLRLGMPVGPSNWQEVKELQDLAKRDEYFADKVKRGALSPEDFRNLWFKGKISRTAYENYVTRYFYPKRALFKQQRYNFRGR